jgi:hypothetical protein
MLDLPYWPELLKSPRLLTWPEVATFEEGRRAFDWLGAGAGSAPPATERELLVLFHGVLQRRDAEEAATGVRAVLLRLTELIPWMVGHVLAELATRVVDIDAGDHPAGER